MCVEKMCKTKKDPLFAARERNGALWKGRIGLG